MTKVLLTGATGLVGSHIAELFSARGIPLKCLVRPSGDLTFLKQLGVELAEGDITDLASVITALDEVDYVIHTAGMSADWGSYQDFYRANVLGTMNIIKACLARGIHSLVITGSVSSYGEENCASIKNEDSPYRSHYPYFLHDLLPSAMNHYRDTKALLTRQACAFARRHNLDLTVIEPAWVYGEREFHTGFFEYLKAVQSGMRFAPGSRTNSFHVIYAADLAEAYWLACQKRLPGVQRLIIGNPRPERLNEIHTLFCRAAGLEAPKLLPRCLVYPVGFGMELTALLKASHHPPLLTRSRVSMMYDSIGFSSNKAATLLGFTAKTPLAEGINRTVAWYKQQGLLPGKEKVPDMKKHKLYGIHKALFILRVKVRVAAYFFIKFLRDRQLKHFILTLRRLNYFIGKIAHNKFARIGANIRMDMYVPGFPSRAFFTACQKFSVFGEKLPCTVALISVTSACTYHCAHCYQRLDIGKDVELDTLIQAVRHLQDSGIAFFNIEGGEPFLTFDRLLNVCKAIDDRSEVWVNTTGHGLTRDKLLELKKANLTVIMFSLHAPTEEATNAFMGSPHAWQNMVEAIRICHSLGVPVAFNSCLALEDFRNGNFEKVMRQARDFGGFLVQLIKPKPSGAWLDSGVEEYGAADFELVKSKVQLYNLNPQYRDYPAISAQIMEEDPDMFGCTAGGTDRVYINAKGDVQPCEFLNISFGNIAREDFAGIFKAMREAFAIPQTCITCELYSQEIARIYRDNGLKQLPLPKELSIKLCEGMKRDSPTRLYRKIEKELG